MDTDIMAGMPPITAAITLRRTTSRPIAMPLIMEAITTRAAITVIIGPTCVEHITVIGLTCAEQHTCATGGDVGSILRSKQKARVDGMRGPYVGSRRQ